MRAVTGSLAALQALGPDRAAAYWLERLQDDATGDEALFQIWLAADEANRDAWDRALDLWDSFDVADGVEELEALRREALSMPPDRRAFPWHGYAIAASLAAAVGAVGWFTLAPPTDGDAERRIARVEAPDPQRFGMADYRTAIGETKTVALADGSKVTLDTDSAVDIAMGGKDRLVRLLRGQAYFDVAHDPASPFRVAVGERVVSVLGTRFNAKLSSRETRILLVQGAIAVSKGGDPADPAPAFRQLSPGDQLVVRAGMADRVSKVDPAAGLEWRRGFVQFDGDMLGDAVEELNRYSAKKLLVRQPAVAGLRISGAFPTGKPDQFVETLSALYPVRAVATPDRNLEIVSRR